MYVDLGRVGQRDLHLLDVDRLVLAIDVEVHCPALVDELCAVALDLLEELGQRVYRRLVVVPVVEFFPRNVLVVVLNIPVRILTNVEQTEVAVGDAFLGLAALLLGHQVDQLTLVVVLKVAAIHARVVLGWRHEHHGVLLAARHERCDVSLATHAVECVHSSTRRGGLGRLRSGLARVGLVLLAGGALCLLRLLGLGDVLAFRGVCILRQGGWELAVRHV